MESQQKGFTLIEVLVASLLMVLTATFAGRYFISSKTSAAKSDDMFEATEAAFTQLEQIKSQLTNNSDSLYNLVSRLGDTLSLMSFNVISNGWGPVEIDKSNGEYSAGDGNTLTINGTQYKRGIGAHANSVITWDLNGQYNLFKSDIGVDDEVSTTNGSIRFMVYVDDTLKYQSSVMTGANPAKSITVDVKGGNQLKLVITDEGNNGSDHGDWANARLLRSVTDSSLVARGKRNFNIKMSYQTVSPIFKAVKITAEVFENGTKKAQLGTGLAYQ